LVGFQRQASGRTAQGELEQALARIGGKDAGVVGAGRTDSGVHASGQVVAFDLEWAHGAEALGRALNANLPADVAVQTVAECSPEFHPRYSARGRRYRYTLYNHPVRSPLAARYSWQVWPALALAEMQAAAQRLVGRHDFAAFGADPERGESTTRTVTLAQWSAAPGGWMYFDIQADAFLFRMVRSLVGALKRVGQGDLTQAGFEALLASRDRAQCPAIAPPQGLCLVEVLY
jgi:tRNA pseudouridine38-40 synthase